jgi:hypothetical protein
VSETQEELRVGDAAPDVMLTDEQGEGRSFSSFWREHSTAFVFLRHFG